MKSQLRELNIEIVRLEDQADPQHRQVILGKLVAKRDELQSLESAKPIEVVMPGAETAEQKQLAEKIARYTRYAERLNETGQKTVELITLKKNRLQKLVTLLESVSAIDAQSNGQKHELKPICDELGLDIEAILKIVVQTTPIDREIAKKQRLKLEHLNATIIRSSQPHLIWTNSQVCRI